MFIPNMARRVASIFSEDCQLEIKRILYRRKIRNGTFTTKEPEYAILSSLVEPGSCVIDVGANIGHYTKRLSELVGQSGRVIAFEPVPETFSLLASNMRCAKCKNVSLINAAVSDKCDFVGMAVPCYQDGFKNYYQAHVTNDTNSNSFAVLTLSIDTLALPKRVSLVKIDAEGHELSVLNGMVELLRRDRPVLIIENGTTEVNFLTAFGYKKEKYPDSPNAVFCI